MSTHACPNLTCSAALLLLGPGKPAPERLEVAFEKGQQALAGGTRHVLVLRVGVAGLDLGKLFG
jgi:hypothetical protein